MDKTGGGDRFNAGGTMQIPVLFGCTTHLVPCGHERNEGPEKNTTTASPPLQIIEPTRIAALSSS